MTQQEQNMFGMSVEDIREDYMNSVTAKLSCMEMVIMGVLSDAQEMMAADRPDQANKMMNIAKFILSEQIMQKRAA